MEWQPIDTAPKDGSVVTLTWMEEGKPQEIYPGMVWNAFAGNAMVQSGKGIWCIRSSDGKIQLTWSEEDVDGAPTHWRIE